MRRIALALLCLIGFSSLVRADVYDNPQVADSTGILRSLWARTTTEAIENVNQFCAEQDDGEYLGWSGPRCGTRSTPYLDWNINAWRTVTSGSKNVTTCNTSGTGYPLVGTATCGWKDPTAVTITFATRRILMDLNQPAIGAANAKQACLERGKPNWSYYTGTTASGTAATMDPVFGWVDIAISNRRIMTKLVCLNE